MKDSEIIEILKKRCKNYGWIRKDFKFIEFIAEKLLKILREKNMLKCQLKK